jgi:Protein of unknown function (DUF2815)
MADNPGYVEITKSAVTTYPQLITAQKFERNGKASGEPKFSINWEFETDHPALDILKSTAAKIAAARWPGRDFTTLAFPFSDGTKLADAAKGRGKAREFSRGKVVMISRSGEDYPPQLSAIVNGQWEDFEGDYRAKAKPYFYSGARCIGRVVFKAYDGVGNNPDGVACYLAGIGSLNKGDKVGGGGSQADRFKGYVGVESDEDPLAERQPSQGIPL